MTGAGPARRPTGPFFFRIACLSACLFSAAAWAGAPGAPLPAGQEEKVEVRLVLVDLVVLDRRGDPVHGLKKEDFTLLVQNRPVPIDTLDQACRQEDRNSPEAGSDTAPAPGRTVLLFDDYHMDMGDRIEALKAARKIVGSLPEEGGEEAMVAVLSDGLRVLQPFTGDKDRLSCALDSMRNDVTLWARLFEPPFRPLTEKGFFEDLGRLMSVLSGYDGSKAVVMFSSFLGKADREDLWYLDVAHRAAEARAMFYPVYARGLEPPDGGRRTEPAGGSRALARLANESGGRFTRLTNDLTVGYRRARADLSCRYTLGFYLDRNGKNQVEDTRNVVVRVQGRGLSVRHPERIRAWSEADLREAAVTAAEYDPERFRDCSLQAGLDLLKPKNRRKWKVRGAVRLEPVGDMAAPAGRLVFLVSKNRKAIRRFESTLRPGDGGEKHWTFTLPPGDYELTTVLDDPNLPGPKTGTGSAGVPAIPAASSGSTRSRATYEFFDRSLPAPRKVSKTRVTRLTPPWARPRSRSSSVAYGMPRSGVVPLAVDLL